MRNMNESLETLANVPTPVHIFCERDTSSIKYSNLNFPEKAPKENNNHDKETVALKSLYDM
jgi:hypothetical protein